jgi:hypothetical protein
VDREKKNKHKYRNVIKGPPKMSKGSEMPGNLLFKDIQYQPLEELQIKHHDSKTLIVEAVATKEGVWKGVYRPGHLVKESVRWLKGVPVTLNHPPMSMGGKAFASIAVGQVQDAWYEPEGNKAKVRMELWEDKLPPEITQRINTGKGQDVSTGFYALEAPTPGVWQGHDYQRTEQTLDFDHLSIVPLGACSQIDGCGINVHSADLAEIDLHGATPEKVDEYFAKALGWMCAIHHSEDKAELESARTFLDRTLIEKISRDKGTSKIDILGMHSCPRSIFTHSYDRIALGLNKSTIEEKGNNKPQTDGNDGNAYKGKPDSAKEDSGVKIMAEKDGKEGAAGAGELTLNKPEDLAAMLAAIDGEKTPEAKSTRAIDILKHMQTAWAGQAGPFAPPKAVEAVYPVVSAPTPGEQGAEKLELKWETTPDLEKSKASITQAIQGWHSAAVQSGQALATMTQEMTQLHDGIKGDLISQIKQHSGLSDPELEPYKGFSIDGLKAVLLGFQKIKQHGGEGSGRRQTPLDPPADQGGKKPTAQEIGAQFDARLGRKSPGGA